MQDGLGPKRCFQILKIQILEYKLGSFVSTSLHCDPKTLHTYTMAGFELMIFCTGCGSKEGLQSRKEIFQIPQPPSEHGTFIRMHKDHCLMLKATFLFTSEIPSQPKHFRSKSLLAYKRICIFSLTYFH
jgi:hypothetical protein